MVSFVLAFTTLKVYVDDFTIAHRVSGSIGIYEAANKLYRIVERLHELLATADFKCTNDKNVFLTHKRDYAHVLEQVLSQWKYTHEHATKLLGVDYAGGNNIRYVNANLRLEKAKRAANAIAAYDISGVSVTNAVRAHTAGCTQYGVTTVGMDNHTLASVTTTLRATTSTAAKGGSATADLLLQESKYSHPAYAAHVAPFKK